MAECYFCGKKLSKLMDSGTPIFEDGTHADLLMCVDCRNQRSRLRRDPGFVINADTKKFAEKIIGRGDCPTEVKALVQSWIDEGKKKLHDIGVDQQKQEMFETIKHKMPMTTGYTFEGYTILSYHGIATGDSVLGSGFLSDASAAVSDISGGESSKMIGKISQARDLAKARMVEEAFMKLNANAIIGVTFQYVALANNMLAVSASGTAVVIKKTEP